jgi:hypothetical protein
VSGYSVLFNIELKQQAKQAGGPNRVYLEPNSAQFNQQLQLLAVMHHDRSMVLRADAISVSE